MAQPLNLNVLKTNSYHQKYQNQQICKSRQGYTYIFDGLGNSWGKTFMKKEDFNKI